MIQCASCKTMNLPGGTHCKACSADLLHDSPAKRLRRWLKWLIELTLLLLVTACVVVLVILAFYFISSDPQSFYFNRVGGCIAVLAFALIFVWVAIALQLEQDRVAPPLYQLYGERAERHISVDPEQAEADFTEALRLGGGKYRIPRAEFYRGIGKLEDAAADYSEHIHWLETERPGATKSLHAAYTERASIYEKLGRLDDALADIDKTIDILERRHRSAKRYPELSKWRARIKRRMALKSKGREDIPEILEEDLSTLDYAAGIEALKILAEAGPRSIDRMLIQHLLDDEELAGFIADPVTAPFVIGTDELLELAGLSDNDLWAIVREHPPADLQDIIPKLVDPRTQKNLTKTELDKLEKGRVLTLRKVAAATLLMARGHSITGENEGAVISRAAE